MAIDSHDPMSPRLGPHAPRRFCPRCRRDAESSSGPACPHCGDRLVAQGYCPVCEDYWRLPVGAICPKHDIPLEPERPARAPAELVGKAGDWVTVGRFTDSLAAEAPRIRLEAEGIPTFLDGERMGSRSMYHVATGGVALKVPEALASDARIILSQTWSATAAELDIEDDHDDLQEPWPEPSPPETPPGKRLLREIDLALIALLLGLVCYALYEWILRR